MKTILVVLIVILVAIPLLTLLGKGVKLIVVDLPRNNPRLGWPVAAAVVVGMVWLVWRYAAVHHHRWR